MFDSEALEVAIGMSFLFLAMSLVCSAVQEALEGVFKWRAMDLERALRILLADPDGAIAKQLLEHPMLDGLFPGRYDPRQLRSSWFTPGAGARHMRLTQRRNLPSYLPSGHFAIALLDSIARGPAGARPGRDDGIVDDLGAAAGSPLTIDTLRAAVLQLPPGAVQRAVLAALDHADGDLATARRNVEKWYDGAMARASGWYKRRTQLVLFVMGLVVAVGLNVDALHVMRSLVNDKAFRAAVVREAARAPDLAAANASSRAALDAVAMPIGWRLWNAPTAPQATRPVPVQLCATASGPCQRTRWIDGDWTLVVCGWLLTAFAITLGAPFWFDVLNKFMMARASAKPADAKASDAAAPPPSGVMDR